MRNMQTSERRTGWAHSVALLTLAATVGGTLLVGGYAAAGAPETPRTSPTAAARAVGTTSLQPTVESTITGRIETLAGESVVARRDVAGGAMTRQIPDGTEVEILCQALGINAPGDPADFGKPPLADTTWYRLSPSGDPTLDSTALPSEWIPQNPVMTDDPIPACPPALLR